MKCPHCTLGIAETWRYASLGADGPQGASATSVESMTMQCPACHRLILALQFKTIKAGDPPSVEERRELVYPKRAGAAPPPPEVPEPFRTDYMEAAATLPVSAQAGAAFSRRCLQTVLRDKAGTARRDLSRQIDEVLDSHTLPSDLAQDLDAIRAVGNFGAHEQKSTATGMVLPVEPGESEWTLAVLEGVLDFHFVRPAKSQARRDAFNTKLADAGKPPLKVPPAT